VRFFENSLGDIEIKQEGIEYIGTFVGGGTERIAEKCSMPHAGATYTAKAGAAMDFRSSESRAAQRAPTRRRDQQFAASNSLNQRA
jgi:hypothetical protein